VNWISPKLLYVGFLRSIGDWLVPLQAGKFVGHVFTPKVRDTIPPFQNELRLTFNSFFPYRYFRFYTVEVSLIAWILFAWIKVRAILILFILDSSISSKLFFL
jgi:hypothetical protein